MHLFVALWNHSERPEKVVERLKSFGLTDPWLVRARSAAAALSTDVPLFAGLRGLALGADEDRLVALTVVSWAPEEVERVVQRLQLEMDADEPPAGRVFAVPVVAATNPGRG